MMKRQTVPAIRFKGFDDKWSSYRIGDNAEIITGGTPKTGNDEFWHPQEIPWMSSGEINKKRLKSTDNKISALGLENSSAKWVRENSVLVALAGQGKTRGTVAINELPLTTNQSIAAIQPNGKLSSEFIFQNLEKRYDELRLISSGDGTRGGLNKQIIANIRVISPGLPEQSTIGSLFQKLDRLIALHQDKLALMKAQKQTYLRLMIPQKGHKVPELRFQGFTGEWEEKRLGDLGDTFSGLSGKTKDDFGHGEAKFITYVNVFNNPISEFSGTESIEVDSKQTQVEYGDVLFTTSSETHEEVGMSSVWLYSQENIYLNSFCFGFRPKVKLDLYYLAFMLRSPEVRKKISFLAQGISRYNISKKGVLALELPFPTLEEQTAIGNFFQSLDKSIALQESKVEQLRAQKKSLLSKMFV